MVNYKNVSDGIVTYVNPMVHKFQYFSIY